VKGVLRILACALALGVLPGAGASDVIAGKVVGVQDGDTLTVLDGEQRRHRIRLAGIDAPEKDQPFGQAARRSLYAATYRKSVHAQCDKTDRYGRRVCRVRLADRDVALRQVERGFAWHLRQFEHEQPPEDRARYAAAERKARERRDGLWADDRSVPPWEWRRLAKAAPVH